MKSFIKHLLLLLLLLSATLRSISQSDGSRVCLQQEKYNPIIKQINIVEKNQDDSNTVIINIKDGRCLNTTYLFSEKNIPTNELRNEYTYDQYGKILSVNEYYYDNYKGENVSDFHQCVYDKENRLKSYLINRSIGNKLEKFQETIYYLNGKDSVKYDGIAYSNICSKRIISNNDSSYLETLTDTLGNLQSKKYYVLGKLLSMRYYDKGKEDFGLFNFYEDNLLKMEIKEQFDDITEMSRIYQITNFIYDSSNRLIEEREYDGNSELMTITTVEYNEMGLLKKKIIAYLFSGGKRVYNYEYKYWD